MSPGGVGGGGWWQVRAKELPCANQLFALRGWQALTCSPRQVASHRHRPQRGHQHPPVFTQPLSVMSKLDTFRSLGQKRNISDPQDTSPMGNWVVTITGRLRILSYTSPVGTW